MARDNRRRNDDKENDPPRRRRREESDDNGREESASTSNSMLIWSIIGAAAVIALTLGGYFLFKKDKKPEPGNEVVQNPKGDPLPKGVPQPSTKTSAQIAPNSKIKPSPKVPLVDTNILQPFSHHVRFDPIRMNLERVLVSDREDVIGVFWSRFDGGKRTSYFDRHDTSSGKRLDRLEIPNRTLIQHATLSPDGNLLLLYGVHSGSQVGYSCTLQSFADNKVLLKDWQPFPQNEAVTSLNFGEFVSPVRFVSVTKTRKVELWSVPDGKRLQSLEIKGTPQYLAGQDPYSHQHKDVALSADRKTLAVWNGDGVTLIDTLAGMEIGKTPGIPDIVRKSLEVKGTCFHPSGQEVYVWLEIRKDTSSPQPEHFLVSWKTGDRSRQGLVPFNANGYLAQVMTWWGPDHLLLHRGIPGQAIILHPVTGQPIGELMGPNLGRLSHQRNGSLWYFGADFDPAMTYANRIEFPVRILLDANPWTNGNMKRVWMYEKGVSIGPNPADVRQDIGLIAQPKK